jgi:formylglycine-generating enzyme required for sulfatase activity
MKITFLSNFLKLQKTILLLSVSLALFARQAQANNIAVSNASIVGQNTTAGVNNAANFSLVKFDLSWENSWRTSSGPSNWDAAWVFVKFRVGASDPTFSGVSSSGTTVTVSSTTNLRVGMPVRVTSGTGAFAANSVVSSITNATQFVVSATPTTPLSSASIECIRIWEHARLNNTGHTAASGSTIDVPTDGTGAFIYRSSAGSGTNTFNNTQLRWNYGANTVRDDAIVSIQVFAIEMVYVPGGVSFNVGGGGGTSAFTSTTINTDNATVAGGFPTGQTAPANTSWPNGYNAFYCMKYEISQGQYRDFLNTLTRTQQANRVTMDGTVGRYAGGFTWNGSAWSGSEVSNLTSPANRNGLRLTADPGGISPRTYACDLNTSATLPTGVNQSNDGEWIAMNQLNWMDGCAYMQWSGLRPMTELEYEKACRGNQAAVSGEYAWGNATVTGATGISSGGTNTETFSNAGANAAFGNVAGVQGPLRVGAFAGAATTRAQAGATYYGIMEMSGNLWERAVTIGDATGRAFTGLHGSGLLSTAGHATTTAWPGLTSGEVTGATGSGFRGGAWYSDAASLRVSDRDVAASTNALRSSNYGFRGVRLAP